MSDFYETDEPGAPEELTEYQGLRPGDAVVYTGPMPLAGVFVITELIRFGPGWVHALLDGGEWEVDAANLAPAP